MLYNRKDGVNMMTKRKLNKKLDMILYRQNLLAKVIFDTHLNQRQRQKVAEKWNGWAIDVSLSRDYYNYLERLDNRVKDIEKRVWLQNDDGQ